MMHAGQYAFIGRKNRKRDFRQLWITRISAGVKMASETLNYSRFMKALKDNNIQLDRKILADMAATDFTAFKSLVNQVVGK
jgi:large subunit ribosomal protein L20